MSAIGSSGKAQSRSYTPAEMEKAVWMVQTLRAELGTTQGTIRLVAPRIAPRSMVGLGRPAPEL